MTYKPKFSQVETSVARQLSINTQKKGFARNKVDLAPVCMASEG